MRSKIAVVISALFLMLGLGTLFSTGAMAGTGSTWCTAPTHENCINAWNGGPYVKYYTAGGTGGSNSDFTVYLGGSLGNNVILRFSGNSGWADGRHCIGDAGNDPNQADSSLDICDIGAGQFGWGTLFTAGYSGCPSGYEWFHNNHWNGYLGPGSSSNGSPMYLNKQGKTCFLEGPAQ